VGNFSVAEGRPLRIHSKSPNSVIGLMTAILRCFA